VVGYQIVRGLDGHLNKWVLLVGLVAVMLLAAWAIHRLVERPLAPILRRTLRSALADARQPEPKRAMMSP
jgi:peptidoglycan/LPS O-acetylase OafA/YrhL